MTHDIDISKIQPGDHIEATYEGHEFSGEVWGSGTLIVGSTYVRYSDGSTPTNITVTAHTPKPKPSLVERMADAWEADRGESMLDAMAAALAVVRDEIEGLDRPPITNNYRGHCSDAAIDERRRILAALTPDHPVGGAR